MDLSEGILIVVILVLLYVAYQKYNTEETFSIKASCASVKPAPRVVSAPPVDVLDPIETFESPSPELEYKDWVTMQAVDGNVLKNHREYIRDQEANHLLGGLARTSKIRPEQEPYQDVPWMGLRPPRAVAVDNPLQVAEYHPQNYVTGQIRLV